MYAQGVCTFPKFFLHCSCEQSESSVILPTLCKGQLNSSHVAKAGTQPGFQPWTKLDHLFEHQSTAPFVVYRLIQRLVTSNPSPRYMKSVHSVQGNTTTWDSLDAMVTVTVLSSHQTWGPLPTWAYVLLDPTRRSSKCTRPWKNLPLQMMCPMSSIERSTLCLRVSRGRLRTPSGTTEQRPCHKRPLLFAFETDWRWMKGAVRTSLAVCRTMHAR